MGGRIGRHHQDVLRGRDRDDGLEIPARIEARHRRHGDIGGERLGAEMDRVAVGRCLRGRDGAEIAGRAAAILDHHGLAPLLGELLRQDAPEGVDGAAGRERQHHAHRPGRIGLRAHVCRGRQDSDHDGRSPEGVRPKRRSLRA
jgi:hypothetical protein